jgi:hypothetical protein
LSDDRDGIPDPYVGGLNGRDAIAERLQAGGLTIGNPVVNESKRNFREHGILAKTARQLKSDDWALAAQMSTPGIAKRAAFAGQLRAGSDAVTWLKARNARSHFYNPHAELVAKQLNRRFGLQSFLDPVKGKGANASC